MKKGFAIAALAAMIFALPVTTHAHSYDRDDDGHFLRYVAHAIHPVGIFLEYRVFRPIHKWISTDERRARWFGHDPRPGDDYDTWK